MNRRASVVLDVVVGLSVLAVGGLAVTALLANAARQVRRANDLRSASSWLGETADSIAWVGATGSGRRSFPHGQVRWRPGPGGLTELGAWVGDTTGIADARAWVWIPAGPPP